MFGENSGGFRRASPLGPGRFFLRPGGVRTPSPARRGEGVRPDPPANSPPPEWGLPTRKRSLGPGACFGALGRSHLGDHGLANVLETILEKSAWKRGNRVISGKTIKFWKIMSKTIEAPMSNLNLTAKKLKPNQPLSPRPEISLLNNPFKISRKKQAKTRVIVLKYHQNTRKGVKSLK